LHVHDAQAQSLSRTASMAPGARKPLMSLIMSTPAMMASRITCGL
jgi:hypothetical protein